MPPKLPYEASSTGTDSNMLESDTNYQHTRQPSNISEMSVGEILDKYSDDSHLLNHILFAKAQEDRRIAAEEWRQAEEVRLQSKYIEFELNQRQDGTAIPNSSNSGCCNTDINQTIDNFFSGDQDDNANTASLFDTSFLDQHDHFSDHSSSLQAGTSPMPMITSEFHYGLQQQQHQHQHQEDASIASSSPSIDLLSPSMFDVYGHDNSNMMISSSPPEMDLPLFPSTLPTAPIVPSSIPIARSGRANSEKTTPTPTPTSKASTKKTGMHRTLSYECVLNLGTLNMNNNKSKRNNSASPPSIQPLDHDKVMEALRAKLRKSSSPYQNSRPKPSPEPVPPPNTYPTTGVLLLNLKSRRRKSSVTKRSSSSSSSSSKP